MPGARPYPLSRATYLKESMDPAADPREDVLKCGDIVFLKDHPRGWPLRVYRVGFGFYEGEIRVARMREDINVHENGRWVLASRCLRLDVNDVLECLDRVQEAIDSGLFFEPGTRCRFLGWDEDGDARVLVYGCRHTVVFRKDLDKMTLL